MRGSKIADFIEECLWPDGEYVDKDFSIGYFTLKRKTRIEMQQKILFLLSTNKIIDIEMEDKEAVKSVTIKNKRGKKTKILFFDEETNKVKNNANNGKFVEILDI